MIAPARARRLVLEHCPAPVRCTLPIGEAPGHVLAEDVTAPLDMPPFDNSAMDGFALHSNDTRDAGPGRAVHLTLDGTVFAGDGSRRRVRRGCARAVMTGAPLPPGADAVVPVERVSTEGGALVLEEAVAAGQHVRRRGEEIARGTALLSAGMAVHAGTVAVLAAAGRARARLFRKPQVAVVSTGSETVAPGRRIRHGQIYDSNGAMVVAMARGAGFEVARLRSVKDHPAALRSALAAALRCADVVVVTGGVSVGERDYLRAVLERLRVHEVFWRVSQKPGKPLYFGRRSRRLVFGLPGNPASAFTCFHMYVYPALKRMAGASGEWPRRLQRTLDEPVAHDSRRWRYLKAAAAPGRNTVSALPAQASHMISSLARTNALIEIPPGAGSVGAGDTVTVYRLPAVE